jgi:NAD(P)-dependent dehydrogenase (short-subunit alcohol dehydrogenase family)
VFFSQEQQVISVHSAVVLELLNAGHQVVGLTRSDHGAAMSGSLGAEVHRGDLDDLDSLRSGVAAADGVIHLAFKHDFSDFAGSLGCDLCAVQAMGTALEGSDKPYITTVHTSGEASDCCARYTNKRNARVFCADSGPLRLETQTTRTDSRP